MDLQQLQIFINSFTELINKNQQNEINIKNLNDKILSNELKIQEWNNKEYIYITEIDNLKNIINTLKKENSEKSSKTIWETTQQKLKEKDEIIEELKKTIEFYKRTKNVITTSYEKIKEEPKVEPKEEPKEELKEEPKEELKEEPKKKLKEEKPKKRITKIKKQPIELTEEELEKQLLGL